MMSKKVRDADALIEKYIMWDSNWSTADEARVKGYGMNVWALVAQWQIENGDISEVAKAYDVPDEVVEATLAFYRRHKKVIDARLTLNRAWY
jgi:uncharacterized protein (DUF433 family)